MTRTMTAMESETLTSTSDIQITVSDPDLVAELRSRRDEEREEFAEGALRIGVIALRHAGTRIDAETVRRESDRLVAQMRDTFRQQQEGLLREVSSAMREYLDPKDGRFAERVERLVGRDGELERVLRQQVGGNGSELVRTLSQHVGEGSPLLKVLDPERKGGVLSQFTSSLETELERQREAILRQFSLDIPDSALSRLVAELEERHGRLGADLGTRVEEVVGELSLDNEDSALSRLVRRVEAAQRTISAELSLDDASSALARVRRELLGVLEEQHQKDETFRLQVVEQLTALAIRRQETARSAHRGTEFEDDVFGHVDRLCSAAGDVAEHVGATKGEVGRCRKGDVLVTLGSDRAAAGARVVIEAKERHGVTMAQARQEIDEARKNRGACAGIFVFSAATAPEGTEPFTRHGDDVFIVWDARDPATDVYLRAGLSLAVAICTRGVVKADAARADFEGLERALADVERQVQRLDVVKTQAETIQRSSEKLLTQERLMRSDIERDIEIMRARVDGIRGVMDGEAA